MRDCEWFVRFKMLQIFRIIKCDWNKIYSPWLFGVWRFSANIMFICEVKGNTWRWLYNLWALVLIEVFYWKILFSMVLLKINILKKMINHQWQQFIIFIGFEPLEILLNFFFAILLLLLNFYFHIFLRLCVAQYNTHECEQENMWHMSRDQSVAAFKNQIYMPYN